MSATAKVAAAVTVLLAIVLLLTAAPAVGAGTGEIGCGTGVGQFFTDEARATVAAIIATRILRAAISATAAMAMVSPRFTRRNAKTRSHTEEAGDERTDRAAPRCSATDEPSDAINLRCVHRGLLRRMRSQRLCQPLPL